jgi:stearoyl-CoA desaturase (delta-9 desaturase)
LLIRYLKTVPFLSMHLACLGVLFTGVHAFDVVLCVLFYLVRMFGITAGYHRYFAHRAYKTSRPMQFVLAWLGCMSMQKGPLWWAANHRHHHLYSDTDKDPHSPITRSFWWAHLGWVISDQFDETEWKTIRDFTGFRELLWLNTLHWVPGIVLAAFAWLAGGFSPIFLGWIGFDLGDAAFSFPRAWSALFAGFFLSTVLLYHGTFAVNSICHILGRRRYATTDQSRNNWWVALFTGGEGWHNNHHHYQSSANQGFFWWEVDTSYYMIRLLALCGLVWDVRTPPANKLIVPGPEAAPIAEDAAPLAVPGEDIVPLPVPKPITSVLLN